VKLETVAGKIFQMNTTNVSQGGLGLSGITDPLRLAGDLKVELTLPEEPHVVTAIGSIAWADATGVAGLRFIDMEPASRNILESWLARKREEEGWK
jgi:hypothetical protein